MIRLTEEKLLQYHLQIQTPLWMLWGRQLGWTSRCLMAWPRWPSYDGLMKMAQLLWTDQEGLAHMWKDPKVLVRDTSTNFSPSFIYVVCHDKVKGGKEDEGQEMQQGFRLIWNLLFGPFIFPYSHLTNGLFWHRITFMCKYMNWIKTWRNIFG